MKTLFTLLLLLAASLPVRAESADQAFLAATQAYREGRFADARTGFEQLRSAGYESPALYYNLGNAYYKTGDAARAVLFYERALRLAPGDEDILHNLQLVNLTLPDRIEEAPRLFIWDWWAAVTTWLPAGVQAAVVYALVLFLAGSLTGVALARTYGARRRWFIGAAAAAVAGTVMTGVLLARLSDLARDDRAVILASVTTAKNAPDDGSTDAFVLHGGARLTILTRSGEWWEIRLADGKVGWIRSSAAEAI